MSSREGLAYTKEELSILEEMVGNYSFNTIAKHIKRSPKAVERQLTRMGLINTKMSAGYLSANELSKAISVDYKLLKRWREEHGLPLKRKNLRFGADKNYSWHIYPEDFWKWAENHKDLINWKQYKRDSLHPEPDWLDTAIRECKIPKNNKRLWTKEEDNELWYLFYNRGMKQKAIAERLGRSVNGVEKRLKRLRQERLRKGG